MANTLRTLIPALYDKIGGESYGISTSIVTELPSTGEANTVYLIPDKHAGDNDRYDEYLWANGSWEKIGNTDTLADADTIDELFANAGLSIVQDAQLT